MTTSDPRGPKKLAPPPRGVAGRVGLGREGPPTITGGTRTEGPGLTRQSDVKGGGRAAESAREQI
jgi:hypothetical protein